MDEYTYNGLVEVARGFIEHQPRYNESLAETAARAYREKLLPGPARTESLRALIAQSSSSKWAWLGLSLIAQECLRVGESMPGELSEWTADVLADASESAKQKKRRPRPARESRSEASRNHIVCGLISILADRYGMMPTRNEATEDRVSACEIVAKATMQEIRTVERIWSHRDPHVFAHFPKSVRMNTR